MLGLFAGCSDIRTTATLVMSLPVQKPAQWWGGGNQARRA